MARILVIEDNPANLELMTYLLRAFGHLPLTAGKGNEGLEIAQREMPDMIVCDVQLPDIEGYEVARRLKSQASLRDIPLIAVTALAMVGDRDRILAKGFDGYISKPIVPETFVAQVETFLDPNQHSAFRVSTPVADTAPTNGPEQAIRATVLVVDDSPLNRELMRSILEPFGYAVIGAASVREAIALALERPPDLVVSDLHMPEQNGFDLIRAMKADPRLDQIKIMIHSATVMSEQDRWEALSLGALKFLTRPMEPQIMLAEIEACLF
jgi:two-component system cell cycle response regulator